MTFPQTHKEINIGRVIQNAAVFNFKYSRKNRQISRVIWGGLLLLALLSGCSNLSSNDKSVALKKIDANKKELSAYAIDAIYKEFPDYTSGSRLAVDYIIEYPEFKKHKVFRISDYSSTLYTTYLVVVNKYNYKSYVFPPRIRSFEISNYFEILRDENIKITKDNAKLYVNRLLFLADFKSYQIDNFNDIKSDHPSVKELEIYDFMIHPFYFQSVADKTLMRFNSWYTHGCIREWEIQLSGNGELSYLIIQDVICTLIYF